MKENPKVRRRCDHNTQEVNFEVVDGVEMLRGCIWLTKGKPAGEAHLSGCPKIKEKGACPFVEENLFIEPEKLLR